MKYKRSYDKDKLIKKILIENDIGKDKQILENYSNEEYISVLIDKAELYIVGETLVKEIDEEVATVVGSLVSYMLNVKKNKYIESQGIGRTKVSYFKGLPEDIKAQIRGLNTIWIL